MKPHNALRGLIFATTLACCTLFLAEESLAFYNPSTGRWINRDPIAERGGDNIYESLNNNPTTAIDPLGLVIETHCDSLDDYLNTQGISFQRTGRYCYTFPGTDLGKGAGDVKTIVTRMLFAGTVFTVSSSDGSATDQS